MERQDEAVEPAGCVAQPAALIGDDLVVAAASRLELAGELRPDRLADSGLDVHMDVLGLRPPRECPLIELPPDVAQRTVQLLGPGHVDEAQPSQLSDVSPRTLDVVARKR